MTYGHPEGGFVGDTGPFSSTNYYFALVLLILLPILFNIVKGRLIIVY